jgi:glycosyltransferase involved in cell wall biosynthesis
VCVVPIKQHVRSTGQQTFLNAIVHEKPVLVTSAAGVSDYITDGVTGLIEQDPEALAAAMARLMDDSAVEERRSLGPRARAWVLENATDFHCRDRLLQLVDVMPESMAP